jgi:hypothetical protein
MDRARLLLLPAALHLLLLLLLTQAHRQLAVVLVRPTALQQLPLAARELLQWLTALLLLAKQLL